MPKQGVHVHPDVKKQILERVRSGEPVPKLAEEHGVTRNAIYRWLSQDATAPVSALEIGKLKRENQALLEIIGRLTVELSAEKKRRLAASPMPFLKKRRITKKEFAKSLGIARSTLYYAPKLLKKDWDLKIRIENVLHEHPAYGHERLAIALSANKKRVRRVMKLFGLKPYRRRPKKPWKKRDHGAKDPYPNLLLAVCPDRQNAAWASDFTYIPWRGRWLVPGHGHGSLHQDRGGASYADGAYGGPHPRSLAGCGK